MSDRLDERHQELLTAINELAKRELLSILYRLERLEAPDNTASVRRLPSVETFAEREQVIVEVSERPSVLESSFEE